MPQPERVPTSHSESLTVPIQCDACTGATMRVTAVLPVPLEDGAWETTYLCPSCSGLTKRRHKA
jgi:hypothetical protein